MYRLGHGVKPVIERGTGQGGGHTAGDSGAPPLGDSSWDIRARSSSADRTTDGSDLTERSDELGRSEEVARTSASLLGLVLRASVLAGSTVLAYHDSLATQPGSHSGVIPLLWLVHVPSLVILVVIVLQLTARSDVDIHDRSLDYIIGGGLLGTALLMLCVLPVTLSLFFWIWRLDLLSLPFFVAGAVSITFGIRALWRHRLPI